MGFVQLELGGDIQADGSPMLYRMDESQVGLLPVSLSVSEGCKNEFDEIGF